jgi:hypothetical protein
MKNKLFISSLILISTIIYSCKKDKANDVQPAPTSTTTNNGGTNTGTTTNPPNTTTSTKLKFSDITPIFNANCTSCHNTSSKSANIDLTNYSSTVNAANSGKLLGAIKKQSGFSAMPPSGNLSSTDIGKIETWINDGKLQ